MRSRDDAPPYDAGPFIDIDPDARPSAWYGTWCRVVWQPRGETRTHHACAPFMDGSPYLGRVRLGLGLDQWAEEVDLELTEDEKWRVRDLVDVQLARRPWVEVVCRLGKVRIELCVRPGWADGQGPPYTGDEGWSDA